jgi:hypothetical protein
MTFCRFAGSMDNGTHSGSRSLWRHRATYKRESHPLPISAAQKVAFLSWKMYNSDTNIMYSVCVILLTKLAGLFCAPSQEPLANELT